MPTPAPVQVFTGTGAPTFTPSGVGKGDLYTDVSTGNSYTYDSGWSLLPTPTPPSNVTIQNITTGGLTQQNSGPQFVPNVSLSRSSSHIVALVTMSAQGLQQGLDFNFYLGLPSGSEIGDIVEVFVVSGLNQNTSQHPDPLILFGDPTATFNFIAFLPGGQPFSSLNQYVGNESGGNQCTGITISAGFRKISSNQWAVMWLV